jgi:hypothetical protein
MAKPLKIRAYTPKGKEGNDREIVLHLEQDGDEVKVAMYDSDGEEIDNGEILQFRVASSTGKIVVEVFDDINEKYYEGRDVGLCSCSSELPQGGLVWERGPPFLRRWQHVLLVLHVLHGQIDRRSRRRRGGNVAKRDSKSRGAGWGAGEGDGGEEEGEGKPRFRFDRQVYGGADTGPPLKQSPSCEEGRAGGGLKRWERLGRELYQRSS